MNTDEHGCASQSGLSSIHEKVLAGERLSLEDGLALYETHDILSLGAMANLVRERKNGNAAYFNRNVHINYTNVCCNECVFCAFSRRRSDATAYSLSPAQVANRLRQLDGAAITEVHMVGGVDPALPFSHYLDLLRAIKSVRPDVHVKAFTMVELAQMMRVSRLSPEDTLAKLKQAGLDSCPGGGCEVLSERVHGELFPRKIGPREWLDTQRLVHRAGLRSNATMLYGHIETAAERVQHMIFLRELQDETGGFQAFVPLAFHPENTRLAHLPRATGVDHLKNIAIARLMLDNFDHIKAYWVMLSVKVAQVSLSFGADDLDGTIIDEKITHEAGARTPHGLRAEELIALIRETGRTPVERDTLYRPLHTYGQT